MSAQRREARRARTDARALAAAEVTMTAHAASPARELGFTCQDIARCASDPDQSYGCHRSYGEHRRTYQRDDVAVVLDECTP